jgi:hypothetical protein
MMTENKRYGQYVRFKEGMTWPLPNPDLSHKLRYGVPTQSDLLAAASILDSYGALIFDPEHKRRYVIRTLRFHYREHTHNAEKEGE